jgi:2-amino-4-hydroxy-6-hydroxymethyldihydropteridine diphosphokinase
VHRYLIAIGSNRRGRHGGPEAEVRAAATAIGATALSPVIATPALGPSIRRFANAVALVESAEEPPELLLRLKRIECAFGRRSGRRWGARVIDLDIVLWSSGIWRSPGLTIPHAAFRQRRFVLDPLVAVTPDWRDPQTGLTIRQLAARLTRRAALPRRDPALMGP